MTELVTIDELEAAGLTLADVRQRCRGAVERLDLDGRLCWLRDELAPLLYYPEDLAS
jgi:hypothetical protein